MTIKLLSEEVINKIAAGEVIERPASVVKELVENSLDAGATKITVTIEESGKKLIKVQDNGKGMSKEDAKKAILRHATSKINLAEDLFNLNTLGFRGEALASIAAVSKLQLITNTGEVEGFSLRIDENGQSSSVIAAQKGTTISVEELFYTTPVRKNFLKTDSVELRHIIEVVTKYALLHWNVDFTLIHNGKNLLTAPVAKELRERVASIYGASIAKEMIPLSYKDEEMSITGLIGKPHQARNDKQQQSFFVNGRWVKNDTLFKAVFDGYHSVLFAHKYPIFFLGLELDPKEIDVNIHPQKHEIKIGQKSKIYGVLRGLVRDALQQKELIPKATFSHRPQVKTPKYRFEPSKQTVLQERKVVPTSFPVKRESFTPPVVTNSTLPPMKVLGQIHKTFFLAETPGGVLVIDQHVVEERVLYERFMQQFMHKDVARQTLLQGEVIECTTQDAIHINENKETLGQLGFLVEPFGENTFVLKTVPSIFGRLQAKELFFDVIHNLSTVDKIKEDIITRMACRASVKAGDELTVERMQGLLLELEQAKLPYHCPHGRPIFIRFDVDELEKKFKRK